MLRFRKGALHLTVLAFAILMITVSTAGQRVNTPDPLDKSDTAINPHDFADDYYFQNGIDPARIKSRRFVGDGWSVYGATSNPNQNEVRVLATMPAYDQNGDFHFWFPLGEIGDAAFTKSKTGVRARAAAQDAPIYIFPLARSGQFYGQLRHAPVMKHDWYIMFSRYANPLGLRRPYFVSYTKVAFSDYAKQIIDYLADKNGLGADDMPIVRSIDDLQLLWKYNCVSIEPATALTARGLVDQYLIAPVIVDPTNGAIAEDAFLLMPLKGIDPLPSEMFFVQMFGCLQKNGDWCN